MQAEPSPTAQTRDATYLGLPVEPAEHISTFEQLSFGGFPLADPEHGRLWSGSQASLGWIDPNTGATHVVDNVPGVYLAVYGDSLYRAAWAHNNVARYDVAGEPREAVRRRAPSPLNIAAGPEGVWTSDHNHGYLLRLAPKTMHVVKRIKIGSGKGLGPAGLVWQGTKLWVNVKRDMTLALLDGRTGQVLHRVQLDGVDIGDDLSLTSEGLWAQVFHSDDSGEGQSEWQLVDTRTLRVKARVDTGDHYTATPVEIDGQTWLPVDGVLLHLDPNNGWQPDHAVDLGLSDLRPRFATVGFGSIWISSLVPAAQGSTDVESNRIVRVDVSS